MQPVRVHPVGLAQRGGTDLTTPDKLCHFAFPALTTDYQAVTPPRSRFFLHCNLHCNLHYNLHWPVTSSFYHYKAPRFPVPKRATFPAKGDAFPTKGPAFFTFSRHENQFFLAGKSDFHAATKMLTGFLKYFYTAFPW